MATKLENNKARVSSMNVPAEYFLDEHGRFQIKQYDQKPAFASFLPGIGGPEGVPLWCLYVNRGQAVSSFGVGNKDNAIVEFLSANWAYQLVGIQGFRTFCKIDGRYYEPFQNDLASKQYQFHRNLWVEMDRLVIQEVNETLGLRFEVTYFSPVNKPVGCLCRVVNITNVSSQTCHVDCLDGLPLILPAGFTDTGMKTMRRIHEAYASVRMVSDHVPFYAAKVLAHDEAEVEEVHKGNFYASWLSDGEYLLPVKPYYDSDVIFGEGRDLVTPHQFIDKAALEYNLQVSENKLPCAMAPYKIRLEPDETATAVALAGRVSNETMLLKFLSAFRTLSDFEKESRDSRLLIRSLTQPAFMVSSRPQLDAYARQNYLDNILRGGIPKILPSQSGPKLLHLYSRRHGDAERDYNFFDLPSCPLSSGEGNYRDICQNRRNDIWFYPDAWDHEIRMFVSLLQADGYNPLSIKGYLWSVEEQTDPMQWCPAEDPEARTAFHKLVSRSFLPGELLSWADSFDVEVDHRPQWLNGILSHCQARLTASGHEGGYWIDHWTYILDLLEAFDAVYPDQTAALLTARADIEWFFEPAHVVEREKKYLRRKNGPLQLNAVVNAADKPAALPPVTVLGKLCALLALKAVSLDYEGRGIEMEAGRPGWNDAMNGLPGLFGSSTCEAIEAMRLAQWLLEILPEMPSLDLPVEVARLVDDVNMDLKRPYDWDRSCCIREAFRKRIYENTSSKTKTIPGSEISSLLKGVAARFEAGLTGSVDAKTGLLHTYYAHRPLDDQEVKSCAGSGGSTVAEIRRFDAVPLPLFLEGQVHWLKVCSQEQARRIYQAVRQSPLLDQKLKMYKLNECLGICSPEIGRARTFSRGWFENESIWLHMSCKYLLELVRQGLYREFFTDAETMLVPFMDPKVYGRSILENSSFIASSDCPDPMARGRGFVARLSGTTAEFIQIWLLLTVGKSPFTVHQGQLCFALNPVLPAHWFTREPVTVNWNDGEIQIPSDAFACALLGDILLVYHNPGRQDTYGKEGVCPVRYLLDNQHEIAGAKIEGTFAERIRQRAIRRIDVWLGRGGKVR